METISFSINQRKVHCAPGVTVLEAAQQNGINIPTLCHHPDLKPVGACRLCLVEDEQTGRMMASCVTPAAADMAVLTDSNRIRKHRTNIIRLMMAEHPESCVVCTKGNRCRLRQIAARLGVGAPNLYPMPNFKPLEQANPFIIRDLSKCIMCGKCVRADHELVVIGAIDYNLRGFKSRPATAHDRALEQSNCTFCGVCISMCPTGALSTPHSWAIGTPETESASICGFCGVGCSLTVGTTASRVTTVRPSDLPDSVNRGTLCVRGCFANDFLNSPHRLTHPLIQKNKHPGTNESLRMSWDDVIDHTAARMVEIKRQYGPQSIAFLGSTKCTNEENYMFQKIARLFFGTNNIDANSYGAGRPVLKHLDDLTQGGGRARALSDLYDSEAIFVIGSDPSRTAPVASYYIKRASKKGIPLIVADPRPTELAKFSSCFLPLAPASDAYLINSIAASINNEEAYDHSYIYRNTEDYSRYREALARFDIEKACKNCGLSMAEIKKAAALIKGKKIAFVIGHGILQQQHAVPAIKSLINLSLFTGSLGQQNSGFYIVSRENNAFGSWDMGVAPDQLPGRSDLADDRERKRWERAWRIDLSPDPGLNMVRMIEEAEKGNIKALYVMGENPIRSLPDPGRVKRALSKIDFIVVQDILYSETAQIADVVLPGAAFSEKQGSFTNMEGRIQSFEPVCAPPEDAKADWQILDRLAARLGDSKPADTLTDIRTEIRRLIPMYAGLSNTGYGWVSETSERSIFHIEEKGSLTPFFPLILPEDQPPGQDFPLIVIFGTETCHLGSGGRTGHSKRIQALGLSGEIEISPKESRTAGLQNGDRARMTSRHGTLERTVRIIPDQREGLVFAPLSVENPETMSLIELTPLGDPDSPGWKTCRLRLEKVNP